MLAKSYTTLDGWNPKNNGMLLIFELVQDFFHLWGMGGKPRMTRPDVPTLDALTRKLPARQQLALMLQLQQHAVGDGSDG